MSYTTLFTIALNGDVTAHCEFRNSYRGAFLVWDMMREAFIPDMPNLILHDKVKMRKVWDLYKNVSVPSDCRIVLMTTFDNVMVKKENLSRVIWAMGHYSTCVSDAGHIPEQASALKELLKRDDIYGVCWSQTSVAGVIWEGIYDQATDEHFTFNIFEHNKKQWFLFDELITLDNTR